MRGIDLNADVGESFGRWPMGHDAELMPFISSANVACGAHAGDPNVMAATVKLAHSHGVQVGAHPGYPDLPGFGRRIIPFEPEEITRFVLYQLGALWAIARSEGVALSHVKPHGALYNFAAEDRPVADAISVAVRAFSSQLPLICLPGSEAKESALEHGLLPVAEGFADRAYEVDGLLRSRKHPGSVLSSVEAASRQALDLVNGSVMAFDGTRVAVRVDTICLHSDTPHAALFVQAVRGALDGAGILVRGFANEQRG